METNMRKLKAGFTFIELIIAITILAILTAGAIKLGVDYINRARISSTKSILQSVQTSIETFYSDTGQYPSKLEDLITKPSDAKMSGWGGPYLAKKDVPKDGFKHELQYSITKGAAHPYELYSWGQGGEGSPKEEWIDVWEMEA